MVHDLTENEALVVLLKTRPQRKSWPELASDIAFAGSALAVWRDVSLDSLLPSAETLQAVQEARRDLRVWAEAGLSLVTVLDEDYPSRLLDIRETPPFLFWKGTLAREDIGVSVVGSRKATSRGLDFAARVARGLVDRGLSVIAGLAAGIDTAAHRAALDAGGRTVAFIGTGITHHYPAENRTLQDEIAAEGLLLSQFWPDAPPTKHSFPIRNAAMSGYGLATIVVEAGETSGTRIQARLATEHGRPVILTEEVVQTTTWGNRLAQRPGVYVAVDVKSALARVDDLADSRINFDEALQRAMSGE